MNSVNPNTTLSPSVLSLHGEHLFTNDYDIFLTTLCRCAQVGK